MRSFASSMGVMMDVCQWREDAKGTCCLVTWQRRHCSWRQLVLSHVRHAVILLPLHSPVLEPDLDLSLAEAQLVSHLDASPARQVAVEVELFLQLQSLVTRVRRPCSFAVSAVHAVRAFNNTPTNTSYASHRYCLQANSEETSTIIFYNAAVKYDNRAIIRPTLRITLHDEFLMWPKFGI